MSGQEHSNEDLVASLLANCKKPEDLVGEHGLLKKISNTLMERSVHAESGDDVIFQVREIDHR